MDEQPVQSINEVKVPVPVSQNHAKRVDYEYERAGTASLFMFTEPLAGWRDVKARERGTKVDWAKEIGALLDGRYSQSEKIILVCE